MFKKAKYVYEIYRTGSFTRAAKKLGVSQPCLSSAIKNIEEKLGSPVFERSSTPVLLTAVGKEYIKATERILSVQDSFLTKLDDLSNSECAKLRIGCPTHIMLYAIPDIIRELADKHPHISINALEASSDKLLTMLKDDELDLVIDTFCGANQPSLVIEQIREEKLLLAVPKALQVNDLIKKCSCMPQELYQDGNALSKLSDVPLEIFKEQKFVLVNKSSPLNAYNKLLLQSIGALAQEGSMLAVEQPITAYRLAENGGCCAFLTDTVFKLVSLGSDVKLYKAKAVSTDFILAAAFKKGKVCSAAMSSFIELLKSCLKAQ